MSIRGFVVLSSTCCRLMYPSANFSNLLNSVLKVTSFPQSRCTFSRYNQIRCISKKSKDVDPLNSAETDSKKMRAKSTEIPKITLLDERDNISVCTMQEAEKIAKGRKLRLVQVVDPKLKTQRRTFKLMSEADYLEEELSNKQRLKEEKKKKEAFSKGEKLITISTRSTAHDIEVKVNKALKMLQKKFEVRVIILGSPTTTTPQEEIYQQFEKAFKDFGRIVQKRIKNGDLRFQIIPPKREDSESKSDEQSKDKESGVLEIEEEELSDDKLAAVKKSV